MHSFKYGGVIPKTISYNGAPVKTVWFNGVKVWPSVEAGQKIFPFNYDGYVFIVPDNVKILKLFIGSGEPEYGANTVYVKVNPKQQLSLYSRYRYSGNKPGNGHTYWYINDIKLRLSNTYYGKYALTVNWSDEINNYTGEISHDFT